MCGCANQSYRSCIIPYISDPLSEMVFLNNNLLPIPIFFITFVQPLRFVNLIILGHFSYRVSFLIGHYSIAIATFVGVFSRRKIHIAHSFFLSVVPSIKSALWAPFWLVPRKFLRWRYHVKKKVITGGNYRRIPAAGPSVCDPKSASGFMGRMGLCRPWGFRQTHRCNPVLTRGPVAGVSWECVPVLG